MCIKSWVLSDGVSFVSPSEHWYWPFVLEQHVINSYDCWKNQHWVLGCLSIYPASGAVGGSFGSVSEYYWLIRVSCCVRSWMPGRSSPPAYRVAHACSFCDFYPGSLLVLWMPFVNASDMLAAFLSECDLSLLYSQCSGSFSSLSDLSSHSGSYHFCFPEVWQKGKKLDDTGILFFGSVLIASVWVYSSSTICFDYAVYVQGDLLSSGPHIFPLSSVVFFHTSFPWSLLNLLNVSQLSINVCCFGPFFFFFYASAVIACHFLWFYVGGDLSALIIASVFWSHFSWCCSSILECCWL